MRKAIFAGLSAAALAAAAAFGPHVYAAYLVFNVPPLEVKEIAPMQFIDTIDRTHKKSQTEVIIHIADGDGDGMSIGSMSRQQAEAEIRSLYPDAYAEIWVADGHGGFAPPPKAATFEERFATLK